MSDIPTTTPPPDPAAPTAPVEPIDAVPEVDPATLALFETLRPLLTELLKVGINEAQSSMVIPTVRIGTVELMDPATGSAQVLVDGDTAAVPITVVCEYPVPGDRVRATFWGQGAAFVDGILGGTGFPSSGLLAYVGTIDGDGSSSTGLGPPRGFAWARGQVMSQKAAPGLYARVGTRFNTGGEAADEFRLPDLRGRLVVGLDNMGGSDAGRLSVANTLGATGGAESVTIATGNLPSHTHSFSGSLTGASISGSVSGTTGGQSASHFHQSPTGNLFAEFGGGVIQSGAVGGSSVSGSSNQTNNASNDHTHSFSSSISGGSITGGTVSGTTGSAGSGTALSILPPYMLTHYLVKL